MHFTTAEIKTSHNCHIPRGNPVEQKLSPSRSMIAPCCSQNWHLFQVPFVAYLKFRREGDLWNSAQLKSHLLPFDLPDLKVFLSACEVLLLAILYPYNFLMSSNHAALSGYASGITHWPTYCLTMYKLKTKGFSVLEKVNLKSQDSNGLFTVVKYFLVMWPLTFMHTATYLLSDSKQKFRYTRIIHIKFQ